MLKKILFVCLAVTTVALAACDNVSYVQRESPANAFKDYRENGSAVVGVGEPISSRQMRADAILRVEGHVTLSDLMEQVANTYNVAIRYGAGIRKNSGKDLLIADLKFNEARSYIEDVYKVQIVREGERRLLVLPAADVARIEQFSPGDDVALVDAIRGLAKQCDMNLVITENRERLANTRVSASFKDITCTDAFDAILVPHGLTLVEQGDYFSIGGLPTRTWKLNLYEPLRSETQSISYSASLSGGSASSDTGSNEAGGSGDNAVGGSAEVVIRQDRDLIDELKTDLETLISNSCNTSDGSSSSGLLSPPSSVGDSSGNVAVELPCGYVRLNRSVGVVQMQASRRVLRDADLIIKQTEDIASRRLLVEARIIAVSKERSFEQGTKLASILDVGIKNSNIGVGFSGADTPRIGGPNDSIAGMLANLTSAGGFAGIRDNSIEGVVRFIESFSTTYQLMKPTLEVMDRQKAILIDGRNDVFFVRESEVIASDGGNIVNTTATQKSQFEGIQFAVTAQIASGNDPHTIAVQIPITEIVAQEALIQNFNGQQFSDDIPVVNTRIIDQKVRMRDGEVKVIGGLTRTIAIDKESGVPILRGIPIAGKGVNEENISFEDVEFLVLMQVRRLK